MEKKDKNSIKLVKLWWQRAQNNDVDLIKTMITDSTQIVNRKNRLIGKDQIIGTIKNYKIAPNYVLKKFKVTHFDKITVVTYQVDNLCETGTNFKTKDGVMHSTVLDRQSNKIICWNNFA